MARAKKRRRLPTVIDRGLGLLEVILPYGEHEEPFSSLPPGQRDAGGFWFPVGYTQPGDIFTPAQRKLQAKQRQVQRHRHGGRPVPPPIVSGSDGTNAADTIPSRPHAPPQATLLADRAVPLPAPSREVPAAVLRERLRGPAAPPPPLPRRAAAAGMAGPDTLAVAHSAVVDSLKGSD